MKEFSAEEKANRYDRAIEVIKEYYQKIQYSSLSCASGDIEVLEKAFPELKERGSEDERIMEDIITYLSTAEDKELIPYETWISWIKKRGEQKPTVDIKVIIPKFRVGDIVKSKSQPMLKPRKIISIDKDCYWCEDRGCIGFAWEDDYEIVEQKPEDNVIEEEKPLLEKFRQAVYDCAWGKVTCNVEGESKEEYANRWAEQLLKMVRDWADDYIDKREVDIKRRYFDKGKQSIQKSAWSEEDEDYLNTTIAYLKYAEKLKNWLKSLKERYIQLPGNEQIEVCKKVYADILSARGFDLDTVNSELNRLEEQLKHF